jgi:cytochrome c5
MAVHAQGQTPSRTVLDGVYSEAQASRGKTAYTRACAGCHGDALDGVAAPSLIDSRFMDRWREGTLDALFNFMKERMPPGRGGTLPDNDYLDVLTYILKVNDYRAGPGELTPDLLAMVMLVGKNGPQPVPDGALITTVGCISEEAGGRLVLTRAAEPARTRTSTSTPAELKASSQKNLGTLTFRMADMEAVPGFAPETHKGHKMHAKGYLVRQKDAERINLSSIEMLDSTCN